MDEMSVGGREQSRTLRGQNKLICEQHTGQGRGVASPQDSAGKYLRGACFVPGALLHEALKSLDNSQPGAKGRLLSRL